MKNLIAFCFLLLFVALAADTSAQYKGVETGVNIGLVGTSRGIGIQFGVMHAKPNWWIQYEWTSARYKTRLGELPIYHTMNAQMLPANKNIDWTEVEYRDHGHAMTHQLLIGWKRPINSRCWLGIGSGLSIIQVDRAKQLNFTPQDPNSIFVIDDLFTSLLIDAFDPFQPYKIEFEKSTVVGVPLMLRLQSYHHKVGEMYFQTGGTFAPKNLTSFQATFGMYLRLHSQPK